MTNISKYYFRTGLTEECGWDFSYADAVENVIWGNSELDHAYYWLVRVFEFGIGEI